MQQNGFIRDMVDVKILVLFVTARAVAPIDLVTLTDLCLCDGGVDYFQLSQAVAELVESDHLRREGELYSITGKGRKNGAAWEGSLPFSVRRKCERSLDRVNARLRQETQVRAQVLPRESGGFTLRLDLEDYQGSLMALELYFPTKERAEWLAGRFRAEPDQVYRSVLISLQGDENPKE